jgi:hypothetical protein
MPMPYEEEEAFKMAMLNWSTLGSTATVLSLFLQQVRAKQIAVLATLIIQVCVATT